MKNLMFILFITCGMLLDSTELTSQTERNIELLDFASNKLINVHIKEDWATQKIVLTNWNNSFYDTIEVCDVQEIDTMYIVLSRFLIISYRINGGSGEHLRYSKIFSARKGTLFESLSLLTRHESYSFDGILQRGYNVTFTIKKIKDYYYLSLLEEEKKSNKIIFNKTFKISLNMDSMAFYSSLVERNKAICIEKKSEKCNNDIFRVCLRKESYVFYRKKWYQQDLKGCFYRI